jgi:hypothetical protein
MDENIPELTDEEVSKLPYGTKYKLNGVAYQTFHPTPVGAVLPQSYSAQPQSADAPSSTPSFMDNFSHDWTAAQDNYGKALQVGMSPDDASQLYLKPVHDKWEIASRNKGALLRNPTVFNQFNSEFDAGTKTFQNNYNSYSRDNMPTKRPDKISFDRYGRQVATPQPDIPAPGVENSWAATQPGSIASTIAKWSAAPNFLTQKPLPPDDSGIISRLPQQVINEVKQTAPVPQENKGTDAEPIWKPYSVKMTAKDAKGLRDDTLNNLHSGMNMADATRKAITDRFGDNPSLEPNIVTNKPAIAAQPKWHGVPFTGTDAQPAELGTNYFKVLAGNGNESGDGVVGEDSSPVKFQAPNPIPDAPVDKAERKVNQKYVLPNGKTGTWNGKGWQLVKE